MPCFIAGHAFSHSMLHSLLTQTFYNRHLLHICRKLIFNADAEPFSEDGQRYSPESRTSSKGALFDLGLEEHGVLYQIDLPQVFIDAIRTNDKKAPQRRKRQSSFFGIFSNPSQELQSCPITYGLLFEYLLKKEKTVALGLYRRQEGLNQLIRYTVVNCSKDLLLRKEDRVFVLSSMKAH